MVKVYGVSDDLVEIEGSSYWNDEIGCYKKRRADLVLRRHCYPDKVCDWRYLAD